MKRRILIPILVTCFFHQTAVKTFPAAPYDGDSFQGRIAISSDGNFNDEDDWGAFPTAIAIMDAFGVKDKLVHIDYNNILPQNDPRFYKEMTESVLGAVERYNIPRSTLHDCQNGLEGAVESIKNAIDESSADNPLYFILAGPMEVPFKGIQRSDPEKRKFVYCISHSVWNDGYNHTDRDLFTHNKRAVIPSGIQWIQIRDGNTLLAFPGGVGKISTPKQWKLFHWLRDSKDAKLNWIYSRLKTEKRGDISDACMTYFLFTGDEEADLDKLKHLLDDRIVPKPIFHRKTIRIEAENFNVLEGFRVNFGNDRSASHRLSVQMTKKDAFIKTPFNQPYTADKGLYDVEIRYFDGKEGQCRYSLFINGIQQGEPWISSNNSDRWEIHTIYDVSIQLGDELSLALQKEDGEKAMLDYMQLQ